MFGFGKKYGLKEAEEAEKEINAQGVTPETAVAVKTTTKVMLKVLGVPNVVKEQAQKVLSKIGDQMTTINDKMVGIENADQKDEVETQKTVVETLKERSARKGNRNNEIVILKKMVLRLEKEIERVQHLEKEHA